ncbi:MAG: DnaJ domain-containing protein [Desulforhabdus sp.]|jgi:curved DNA-binding protein CbpA|nr:DnaJ domain-containing protein [Desulforhabdus sp.]
MDLQNSFNVLELPPNASLEEVKQAYKDLVCVWHPDRFVHNPRLRDRAEKKLREINAAHEIITAQLNRSKKTEPKYYDLHNANKTQSEERGNVAADLHFNRPSSAKSSRDKTELMVELGTQALLTGCYSVYKSLRRAVSEFTAQTELKAGMQEQRQASTKNLPLNNRKP